MLKAATQLSRAICRTDCARQVSYSCREEGSRRGLRGRADPESKAGLGAMFAPPLDLMFDGQFEEAQQQAQERNLWLVRSLATARNKLPLLFCFILGQY